MAVYKRGYQRYQGPWTGRWTRLLVLPRFAWRRLLEQRLIVILLVVALFWPTICAMAIYLVNRSELLATLGQDVSSLIAIDSNFFLIFMNAQAVLAVLMAAFAGPSLIAPDLANGALPLYLSRPMTRSEYVVARLLVLIGALAVITWAPGVALFLMQSGMAGWDWFAANWRIGAGIFVGFLMWTALVSLVALASSAYVRWRIVAGALVLGVFFVLTGASALTMAVLRVDWPLLFNPAGAMLQVWRAMLGADPLPGPGATPCLVALGVMVALLLFVLERKLRPVEVVS